MLASLPSAERLNITLKARETAPERKSVSEQQDPRHREGDKDVPVGAQRTRRRLAGRKAGLRGDLLNRGGSPRLCGRNRGQAGGKHQKEQQQSAHGNAPATGRGGSDDSALNRSTSTSRRMRSSP